MVLDIYWDADTMREIEQALLARGFSRSRAKLLANWAGLGARDIEHSLQNAGFAYQEARRFIHQMKVARAARRNAQEARFWSEIRRAVAANKM